MINCFVKTDGDRSSLCNYKAILPDTNQGLDFELVSSLRSATQTSAQKLSLDQATTEGFQDGQWLAVAVEYLSASGKSDSWRSQGNQSSQPRSPLHQLYLFDRYKVENLLLSIRPHRMKLSQFSMSKIRET